MTYLFFSDAVVLCYVVNQSLMRGLGCRQIGRRLDGKVFITSSKSEGVGDTLSYAMHLAA